MKYLKDPFYEMMMHAGGGRRGVWECLEWNNTEICHQPPQPPRVATHIDKHNQLFTKFSQLLNSVIASLFWVSKSDCPKTCLKTEDIPVRELLK